MNSWLERGMHVLNAAAVHTLRKDTPSSPWTPGTARREAPPLDNHTVKRIAALASGLSACSIVHFRATEPAPACSEAQGSQTDTFTSSIARAGPSVAKHPGTWRAGPPRPACSEQAALHPHSPRLWGPEPPAPSGLSGQQLRHALPGARMQVQMACHQTGEPAV